MKRLIRLAAKLYPGPWRARYGEEFEALLDDAGTEGRIAFNVLRGAVLMQVQRRLKVGTGALLAMVALFALSRWAGERPYISPGTHQVFRMDSAPGALLEFLVILSLAIVGVITLVAGRRRWLCPCIAALYFGGVVLVSLVTPRTIISIGDS